ncbi:MAG: hypothetical protein QOC82_751 [Frankiaceae bacterium]|jgi:hypothetical protein|nr:hypothetical protein [Frankiaceae bacterium]
MILLGLLLMCACAAMAVDAVVQNGHITHAAAFNQPIDHLTLGGLFIAGAVLGIVFALGVLMFTGGIGRARRRRIERRTASRQSVAETEALRAHNERLEQELEGQRTTDVSDDATYPTERTHDTDRTVTGGRHRG